MIAEKLVELRTEKGLTQGDVAKNLSVSNKTVSKWETGTSEPDLNALIKISEYFGVTTDTLLGISDDKKKSTKEEVISSFVGLDRNDAVIKAFETVSSCVPAVFPFPYEKLDDDRYNIYPPKTGLSNRNKITRREFFEFSSSTENGNIAVIMLRNEANFKWMNDPDMQKEIVKFFRFLSDADALSVLYYIYSTTCSDYFTADYIAAKTGVDIKRVSEILDELCGVSDCMQLTAHITDGDVKVYTWSPDATVLSIISLAYEWMYNRNSGYDYFDGGKSKMIRGEKDELIG